MNKQAIHTQSRVKNSRINIKLLSENTENNKEVKIYQVILVLATGLVKRSPLKWIVAMIAFTGLVSSILRHCTPYSILGINTAEKSKKPIQEVYSSQQYIKKY